MARLLVQFPGNAEVLINGERRGDVNRVIRLGPGQHTISLDGEPATPREQLVTVTSGDDPDQIIAISFFFAQSPLDRFSPLYCRYNGFLLGQWRDKTAEQKHMRTTQPHSISASRTTPCRN